MKLFWVILASFLRESFAEFLLLHSSSIRVAQCRSRCLNKFGSSTGLDPNYDLCRKQQDCFMCWENCNMLNENIVVWGAMCSRQDICFPGCKEACAFFTENEKFLQDSTQSEKASLNKFPEQIEITPTGGANTALTLTLSWAQPTTSDSSTTPNSSSSIQPIVYIVFRHDKDDGNWKEVAQTTDQSATLRDVTSAVIDVKVLAVTVTGPVAQSITTYSNDNVEFSHVVISNRPASGTGAAAAGTTGASQINPKLVSIRPNYALGSVDVLVSWPPSSGQKSNYLVTWEAKEGTFDITGHLYTDSTTVSLTLWANTVYSIEVELVSAVLSGRRLMPNEPLVIDTSGELLTDEDLLRERAADCTFLLLIVGLAASLTALALLGLIGYCLRKNCRSKNTAAMGLRRCNAIRRKNCSTPKEMETQILGGDKLRNPLVCEQLLNVHKLVEGLGLQGKDFKFVKMNEESFIDSPVSDRRQSQTSLEFLLTPKPTKLDLSTDV